MDARDALLQLAGGSVAGTVLGDYEADGDEGVRVAEALEVIEVLGVVARERGEDEDGLALGDGVGGRGDVVEVVVDNGGSGLLR